MGRNEESAGNGEATLLNVSDFGEKLTKLKTLFFQDTDRLLSEEK